MRLRPDEARINQFNFVQPTDPFHAEREQLFGLERSDHPLSRRNQIPRTRFAPMHGSLLGNPLRDVDAAANAIDTHVGRIPDHRRSTFTAENHRGTSERIGIL